MRKLFGLIVLISILEGFAQYFIKKYNKIHLSIYYLLGASFYAAVAYILNKTYDHASMGITQALWSGSSIVIILTVGAVFFGESISKYEFVGMLLILMGVGVTQIGK